MHSDIIITAFAEPSTTPCAKRWQWPGGFDQRQCVYHINGFKCEQDYKERLEMQVADDGAGLNEHLKIF